MKDSQPELLHLDSDEVTGYPNSPLPVLIYRQAEIERGDPAQLAAVQERAADVNLPKDSPVGGSLATLWGEGA